MKQQVSLRTVFGRARVGLFVVVAIGMIAVILGISGSKQNAKEKRSRNYLTNKLAITDEVTRNIRDGSMAFFRVNVTSQADRDVAVSFGRIVEDYGNFVIIAKPSRTDLKSLTLDNQPIETSINTPGAVFDPIKTPPADTSRYGNAGGYYIVQFGGIATDEWLDSLREMGVEILQYVPHNAFLFMRATKLF